jgi:hypothetical protein
VELLLVAHNRGVCPCSSQLQTGVLQARHREDEFPHTAPLLPR